MTEHDDGVQPEAGRAAARAATAAPGTGWGLLRHVSDQPAAGSAANMAIDAALLEAVQRGAAPVLRLYRWDVPTLSFGRNQPAAGLYDEAEAARRGIAFVRRPTGGQAVLHADELTYTVAAPVDVIGRPREAYRRINEALVAGLRRLGVDAAVAREARAAGAVPPPVDGRGRARSPDWSAACFRAPAEGEVVVVGRKLVGSAQRCEARVILQHGSILISGSQTAAEELLIERRPAVAGADRDAGWTTLENELGERPGRDALVDALVEGFADTFGTALAPRALSIDESWRVQELCAHFASRAWTWRR